MTIKTIEDNLDRASVVLKALGNPHRLRIMAYLAEGEHSVGELERIVGLSQSALSQHLARLRRDNLVKTRRQAQTIFYSLDGQETEMVLAGIVALYGEDAPRIAAVG